jgi:hypothetical protein
MRRARRSARERGRRRHAPGSAVLRACGRRFGGPRGRGRQHCEQDESRRDPRQAGWRTPGPAAPCQRIWSSVRFRPEADVLQASLRGFLPETRYECSLDWRGLFPASSPLRMQRALRRLSSPFAPPCFQPVQIGELTAPGHPGRNETRRPVPNTPPASVRETAWLCRFCPSTILCVSEC